MQYLLCRRVPPGNSVQHHRQINSTADANQNVRRGSIRPTRQNARSNLRWRRCLRVVSGSQIVVRWTVLGRATVLYLLRRRRQNLCSTNPSVIVIDQIELSICATPLLRQCLICLTGYPAVRQITNDNLATMDGREEMTPELVSVKVRQAAWIKLNVAPIPFHQGY